MMARQAEQIGQREVARKLYRTIVERYPETETARKARAKLEEKLEAYKVEMAHQVDQKAKKLEEYK